MELQQKETSLLIEYGNNYGTGSTEYRAFKAFLLNTGRLKQRARLVINGANEHFKGDETPRLPQAPATVAKMSGLQQGQASQQAEQPQSQQSNAQHQGAAVVVEDKKCTLWNSVITDTDNLSTCTVEYKGEESADKIFNSCFEQPINKSDKKPTGFDEFMQDISEGKSLKTISEKYAKSELVVFATFAGVDTEGLTEKQIIKAIK